MMPPAIAPPAFPVAAPPMMAPAVPPMIAPPRVLSCADATGAANNNTNNTKIPAIRTMINSSD
jgi:hypothetical protein